jgi:glutaredoxin
MPSQQVTSLPTRITIVHSDGCHFCHDAHRALTDLARDYPLDVDTVDAHSEHGRWLMQSHRASMSPLVLVDGEFFSHGRLPRRKLEHVLSAQQNAFSTSAGPSDG